MHTAGIAEKLEKKRFPFTSVTQRVAIYGGSFDPIHCGHMYVARQAMQALSLDKVVFMPAGRPPHKPGFVRTAAKHRLAMVVLAIEHEDAFFVSDMEMHAGRPSYTTSTLDRLHELCPQWKPMLILGADSLMTLHQWRESDRVLAMASLAVVYRPGEAQAELEQRANELRDRNGADITLVHCPGLNISSTEIRRALSEGQDPGPLPEGVKDYIIQHRLYRSG